MIIYHDCIFVVLDGLDYSLIIILHSFSRDFFFYFHRLSGCLTLHPWNLLFLIYLLLIAQGYSVMKIWHFVNWSQMSVISHAIDMIKFQEMK